MSRRWMTAIATLLLLMSSTLPAFAATTGPSQPPPAPLTATSVAPTEGATLAAALPPPATLPEQQPLFTDLPADHWAYPAVVRLVKAGVISFVPGGKFRPNDPVTRAELFKMVLTARKIGVAGTCAALFADVPCGAWSAPYAETAYRMAIAEGVGGGLFAPNKAITREQLYTIVIRGTGKRWAASQQGWEQISAALAPFSDRGQVTSYARPAVGLALREQLTAGYPDGTLRPTATATRAEAAALVSRILLEPTALPSVSLDGNKVVYSRQVDMVASKYTTGEPGVGAVTYTGVTVRIGAAAVDPTVIPLGSLLYVEGYGYAVAVDIGGAIKGQRIDLFTYESEDQANLFGLQNRRVWILP